MKKTFTVVALFVLASSTAREASAYCVLGAHPLDSQLIASLGSVPNRDAFAEWVGRAHLRATGRDLGWSENWNPELIKHVLGVLLVEHGVKGPDVNVGRSAEGLFEYSSGINFSSGFHRSKDEYGPMSRGASTSVCNWLNPTSGSCGSFGVNDSYPTWHWTNLSWVEETSSEGFNAKNHWIVDAFQDPDRTIIYYCGSVGPQVDPVYTAGTIVHEAWHHYKGHSSDFDKCETGTKACDTWANAPRSGKWAQLHETRDSGMGSYQLEHRYYCDLSSKPNNWVPIAVSVAASLNAFDQGSRKRWSNYGSAPLTCKAPTNSLKVPSCMSLPDATGYACSPTVTIPPPPGSSDPPTVIPGEECAGVNVCNAGCCFIPRVE